MTAAEVIQNAPGIITAATVFELGLIEE